MDFAIQFAVSFAVGFVISFANYLISKRFLLKGADKYPVSSLIRTVSGIVFLVILFLLGQKTSLISNALLIGGALGLTLPSFFFTARLLKNINDTGKDDNDG